MGRSEEVDTGVPPVPLKLTHYPIHRHSFDRYPTTRARIKLKKSNEPVRIRLINLMKNLLEVGQAQNFSGKKKARDQLTGFLSERNEFG